MKVKFYNEDKKFLFEREFIFHPDNEFIKTLEDGYNPSYFVSRFFTHYFNLDIMSYKLSELIIKEDITIFLRNDDLIKMRDDKINNILLK